jgi:hypothetical protein
LVNRGLLAEVEELLQEAKIPDPLRLEGLELPAQLLFPLRVKPRTLLGALRRRMLAALGLQLGGFLRSKTGSLSRAALLHAGVVLIRECFLFAPPLESAPVEDDGTHRA